MKEIEDKILVTLTATDDVIINASEKIGKLSERLGRIMIKHGKIDHRKTGLIPWLRDYQKVKDIVIQASDELLSSYKSIADYGASHNVYPNPVIVLKLTNRIAQFLNLRIKIGVLDDVLNGLLEDLWDAVEFEDAQKVEIETVAREVIEKTKELPMYV